ncbi:MAG TPA: hypothetical protein V6D11_28305 [Waterburya sp.]|jgi:hypothetical protein
MQSSSNWQQSPKQGTIPNLSPFTQADEIYLLEVFTECRTKLQSALSTAQRYPQLPDIEKGIADAITGIHEAAAVVLEPETYLE